jgi:hypothetical protein
MSRRARKEGKKEYQRGMKMEVAPGFRIRTSALDGLAAGVLY